MEKESNPPFSSVIRPSVGETIILAATSAKDGEDKMLKLSPAMTTAEIIEEISDL
jgi:Ni2+-binding GTPase involved in maturation of urease and hydrogenase